MDGNAKRQKVEAEADAEVEDEVEVDPSTRRDSEGNPGGSGRSRSSSGSGSRTSAASATTAETKTSTSSEGTAAGLRHAPAFKLDDLAIEVFSLPFFEPNPNMEAERRRELGCRTVQAVFEKVLKQRKDVDAAHDALATTLGVEYESVQEYYAASSMVARRRLAEALLKAKYGCEFKECDIRLGTALNPLLLDGGGDDDDDDDASPNHGLNQTARTISTFFMDPLRLAAESERFLLPRTIYVRDCMRTIFGLFREDVESRKRAGAKNTVLVGSPGVGKSILFFLSALYQARERPVGYYRRTRSELEMASLFFMLPGEEGADGNVRVWFSRSINKKSLKKQGGLTSFSLDLENALLIQQEDYYAYVDGPNACDESDLLEGTYDYLCTSGGFPSFTSTEMGKRLWILDGWTREEAIGGLAALHHAESEAEDAYRLCGGRIREMLKACDSMHDVKTKLDNMVDEIDKNMLELAVLSTSRVGTLKNPDRLRTMFERRPTDSTKLDAWKRNMTACQIVDSPYLKERVYAKFGSDPFLQSYILAKASSSGSAEGVFFECLFHQRVRDLNDNDTDKGRLKPVVDDVCWSKGTAAQGLDELDRRNLYWRPSVSNFKAVDAALVHGETLYVFQLTKMDSKPTYDAEALERNFVQDVKRRVGFLGGAVVIFVTPSGTNYRLDRPTPTLGLTYRTSEVDTRSLAAMDESLVQLFRGLQPLLPRAPS
jgi:hypothetical protein